MLEQGQIERDSAAELRQVCAELERRLSAGEACSAEAVFALRPELTGDAALEVIYTEFVAREHLGQLPTPGEFYARFPQWRDGLEQLFEIHETVGAASLDRRAGLSNTPFPDAERWPSVIGLSEALRRIGKYEILGEVGRGGMGVVYKARQIGLNRLVALKMILTGADAGPRERARFRTEAEAAARLQHPNIVQIHEVGEYEGRPFLTLEYVEGGSLEEQLTGAPWPAAESARLVETLARAMHHAHQQGVVHRDLKPANILLSVVNGNGSRQTSGATETLASSATTLPLTTDNRQLITIPKITDFGLARRLSQGDTGTGEPAGQTRTGAILGTPAYMAPEQAAGDGREVGPAADVYALGVILYELLTGRPPFLGVNVLETLEQVRTREPLPPSRLQPALPRDVETICLKCLAKDPGRRYKSAGELAEDLGRFLGGEPIHARPTPAWEKSWKWAKRRPAAALLVASVLSTIAVGLVSSTLLWRQTSAALEREREHNNDLEAALASKLVALAERDWRANDIDAARRHLEECPPAQRGAEWRYLHRVCHASLFVLREPEGKLAMSSLTWSLDGRRLAYLAAGIPKVWDAQSERPSWALTVPKKRILALAFDQDGSLVSVAWPPVVPVLGPAQKTMEVKVWNPENGREISGFEVTLPTASGTLAANGRRLAVSRSGSLTLVDIPGGPTLTTMPFPCASFPLLTLSPDGRNLAWCPEFKSVQVWDTSASAGAGPRPATGVSCLAFSPDGGRLAIACREHGKGVVAIWDHRTAAKPITLRGPGDQIRSVAFSPDGRRLAAGGEDKSVIMWDLNTGKEISTFRGHVGPINTVAFSPDGTRLASGGNDGTVRIWDVRPFDAGTD